MIAYLLIGAAVIIACVLLYKITSKLGVPMLLAFIALGMFFGSDGIVKIHFDNYIFAQQICSTALIFIMFYGGFGTNWREAKPVAIKSMFLSSLGVVLTAGLTGMFCYLVLRFDFLESLLIGAVISSTDAASVFSILRSKRLNLKNHTASMLEVESGSNDPFAYMLTVIILSIMNGNSGFESIPYLIFSQIVFGVVFGVGIAYGTLFLLRRFRLAGGFDAAFVLAIAILSYAAPTALGGNGYLSAYIVGIIIGNQRINNKRVLVNFFDGVMSLMQMLIFFLLGLLAFPSNIPSLLLPSVAIALFLTFVARPLSVFAILTPAKCNLNQQLLVSWCGLRGAASIVFAILVIVNKANIKNDVFHITFIIVLLSIAFQGFLLPFVSRKLNMIDSDYNVLKTFNDYIEEEQVQFIRLSINDSHPWISKLIKSLTLPPD
ncbi:MAG: potassium/proton antiporter, partial [Christensenellales bacterium]